MIYRNTISLLLSASLLIACTTDKEITEEGTIEENNDNNEDTDSSDGDYDDIDLSSLPAPELPSELLSYETQLPSHLQVDTIEDFDNTPNNNPITDAGATLGRVLFYDKRMSKNGTIACASCHSQESSFSDNNTFSTGFEGGETGRHSMPIINLRYYPGGSMFWDERADTLEDQVLMPIQDSVEMGMTLEALVERLSETEYYGPLFENAFGDPEVSSERISFALAQFVRSIVSFDSKFDQEVILAGDVRGDFSGFTAEENRGKEIFFGEHDENSRGMCGTCHMIGNPAASLPPNAPPIDLENLGIFFMPAPANNGLIDDDNGVGDVTGNSDDDGTFKSSSLRNIELTAPYMHDGRFDTLEEVVEHYNSGIEAHPNLHPLLTDGGPGGPGGPAGNPIQLNLSESDKAALVAFMTTLTDTSIMSDERWSDPFPSE